MGKLKAFSAIAISSLVAIMIAAGVSNPNEGSALMIFTMLPMAGALTLILFAIFDYLFVKARIPLTVFFVLVNIAFGLWFRFTF